MTTLNQPLTPLTMQNMAARADAISPPEFLYDKQVTLSPYTSHYILAVQNSLPIYLTNGCCESAHGNPEVFVALGLTHDRYVFATGEVADNAEGRTHQDFYPLTEAEAQLVGESSALITPNCEARMPYALLYQGKKWFAPHICFHFGGDGEQSEAEALEQFDAADATIREKIESVGGVLIRSEYDEVEHGCNETDYTHALIALLPFEVAKAIRGSLSWEGYVEAMGTFLSTP